MSVTRTINLNIQNNADAAAADFRKLDKSVSDVDAEVNRLKSSTKDSETNFKSLANIVKVLGTAFKAAGIGLVIALFAKFTEVLNQNQKVVDFFNTTFEALSLAFNDFFDFVSENFGSIVDAFKAIFEDPIQSIKDLGTAIKNNIIERFTSSIEAIGFLGEAIVKVFKGDFEGAAESAKNAGKELVDVVTGVDDTFDKTVETVGKVVEATSEYVSETVKAATANVELAKSAAIASARNQKIIEEKDREAELLRQIRDDETKSFEERKAASEQLAIVLDEQEKAMKRNAAAIVASAQAQFNKNDSDENQIALIEAQTEAAGVLAQVEGLRSEQKTSDVSLNKEIIDSENAVKESKTRLAIETKRINAEQIENELERLKELQKIDAEERALETIRLQQVVNSAAEGTQAKKDAQIALDEFVVEAERKRLERAKEIGEKEKEIAEGVAALKLEVNKDREQAEIDALEKEFAKKLELAKGNAELTKQVEEKLAEETAAIKKKFRDEERQLQLQGIMEALEIAERGAASIQALGDAVFAHKMKDLEKGSKEEEKVARKQFKFNKALQLGGAIIDAGKAITASLAQSPIAIGAVPNPAGIASLAFAATTSAANIAKIAASKFESPASSTQSPNPSGEISGGEAQAPQFNVVGDSGVNQLAELQQQPTQAFVVSGEVTTAQALDRNRVQNATL